MRGVFANLPMADDSQVSELQKQLAQYCALSKIIRASGTDLREEWIHTRR